MNSRSLSFAALVASVIFAPAKFVYAQDTDAETKALDSTATQWSFQLAYQTMPDYHDDILSSGEPRRAGPTDYLQLRIMMPLAYEKFTILPRITLRHYENSQGESGIGNTEVFALIVPKKWDWGTGRMGIGPLITLPGDVIDLTLILWNIWTKDFPVITSILKSDLSVEFLN